jgi:siroheme decarboxylase
MANRMANRMGPPLDPTERLILNRIQSNFPIASAPYAVIAEDLGLTENDVIARVKKLRQRGIIRRIGGNFVPEKLGYVSTLCAAKVPKDCIERFATVVNRFPGVTHNYLRDNPFNVWFTFIAPSMDIIASSLTIISQETGVTEIINLPATKNFKIKAHFNL